LHKVYLLSKLLNTFTFMDKKMTFTEFVDYSNYSATHVANCLLYKPDSRPAKLAKNMGYKPSDKECTKMRYLIAGKLKLSDLFPKEPETLVG